MSLSRRDKLVRFLHEDAQRITEELGFEWNNLPAAIAEDAVVRLVYEPGKAGLSLTTTLLEVGQILDLYDEEGNAT